jgi:hypothetical protein
MSTALSHPNLPYSLAWFASRHVGPSAGARCRHWAWTGVERRRGGQSAGRRQTEAINHSAISPQPNPYFIRAGRGGRRRAEPAPLSLRPCRWFGGQRSAAFGGCRLASDPRLRGRVALRGAILALSGGRKARLIPRFWARTYKDPQSGAGVGLYAAQQEQPEEPVRNRIAAYWLGIDGVEPTTATPSRPPPSPWLHSPQRHGVARGRYGVCRHPPSAPHSRGRARHQMPRVVGEDAAQPPPPRPDRPRLPQPATASLLRG